MKVIIVRYEAGEHGIFGHLYIDGRFFHTLERNNLENIQNISCITSGTYHAQLDTTSKWSPQDGKLYELANVPNRTQILIHSGNDIDETKGCILIGAERNLENNKLISSRHALTKFMEITNGKNITVQIEDMT